MGCWDPQRYMFDQNFLATGSWSKWRRILPPCCSITALFVSLWPCHWGFASKYCIRVCIFSIDYMLQIELCTINQLTMFVYSPNVRCGVLWPEKYAFILGTAYIAPVVSGHICAKHSLFSILLENSSGPLATNWTMQTGGGRFIFQKQYAFWVVSSLRSGACVSKK